MNNEADTPEPPLKRNELLEFENKVLYKTLLNLRRLEGGKYCHVVAKTYRETREKEDAKRFT